MEGRRIAFIVDTGASLVALQARTASDIGVAPRPEDYKALVATANGNVKGARVRLNDITIGDITVYDVEALVLPDRRWGRTCSACRSCRGCGAMNMPTAAWCSSSRLRCHYSVRETTGPLCGVRALGY